jgi:hypothetical protein
VPQYSFTYPPAGDGLMMSSVASVGHGSWREKRETCEKGATCAICARQSMFSRANNDCPQLLNPTSHQQNDQDQEDHTYPAAGAVTPVRAVRPSRQRAYKE